MRVLVLGVGDAFTLRGFGSSALVEGPEGWLLIDCPDLIHRAIFEAAHEHGLKLNVGEIDDLIITHLHGDHCNGLEAFGFARLVGRLRGEQRPRPRIHTHPAAAAWLWERLAPAMDGPLTKGGRKSTLDDYFDLRGIVPGMNHVLKSVPAGLPAQLASYSNPELPLADALMPRLLRFLAPLAAGSR
jgi:glyoxylase-like metal-dependent hydrolase (beta-lactamase superfamily II)